jgi:hypothetical protein
MKIRYQPRRGNPRVELRDIKGGHELASWTIGQERDIAPGSTVSFQNNGSKPVEQLDAAEAVFRHGPDFVDAATGKNPLYTCACGADALDDGIVDTRRAELPFIAFRDASGRRQCVPDFMADHPEVIPYLRQRDFPESQIDQAQAIIAKRAQPRQAPSPAPAKSEES